MKLTDDNTDPNYYLGIIFNLDSNKDLNYASGASELAGDRYYAWYNLSSGQWETNGKSVIDYMVTSFDLDKTNAYGWERGND